MRAVIDACDAAGIVSHAKTVEGLQAWESIIAHAAERGCDLLVMGSHGRSGFASLFLGSETKDVLKHTTIPCSSSASARARRGPASYRAAA